MPFLQTPSKYTLIPDVNFEKALIAQGIDTDGQNGKVLTSRISSLEYLTIKGGGYTKYATNIHDLTGIKDFVSLKELDCSGNSLTSLDVSKNIRLTRLVSSDNNSLGSLDVTKNTALIFLECSGNALTSLDVTNNIALKYLDFWYNAIKTIDLSKNLDLLELQCTENRLTSLDLSKNISLEKLDISTNQVTNIDVSNNILLNAILCSGNSLTNLDVSKNINLKTLSCSNNQLSNLDIRKNVALNYLFCRSNPNLLTICVTNVNYFKETNSILVRDANQLLVDNCDAPVVTEQNNIPQTTCLNSTFSSISVSAGSTNLTYQWYKSTTATVGTGTSLGNAAQTSSYIPLATELGTSYYYCIVSNPSGSTTSKSFGPFLVNALLVIQTSISPVVCKGKSTGAITASSTSGTAPFTYSWSTGATTATISNLAAASYQVTVTDAKGCSSVKSVTLTEPETELNATISFDPIRCKGSATGTATVIPTGGTAPYFYNWNHGTSQNLITTATVANLNAFTYTVTVVDMNGCFLSKSVKITEPALALTAQATKTNVLCYGSNTGTASVVATGGTSPYSYKWNTGEVVSGLSNLHAGNYSVVSTDANGCNASSNVSVVEPAEITLAVTTSDVTCKGGSNGFINTTATGGVGSYTYGWSNGNTTLQNVNLTSGLYVLTVKDGNACSITKNIMINESATKTQPPIVTSLVSYCYGNETKLLAAQGADLKWYASSSSTTGSVAAPVLSTATSGISVYYVSQTLNGCESDKSIIVAQVYHAVPSPGVIDNVTYCVGAQASALTANGSDLKWYATQTATTSSSAAPVVSTAAVGTKAYYVSQTVAGCESDRSIITVNVNSGPAAPAVATPVVYCQGSAAVPLTATGSNLSWYKSDGTTVSSLPSTSVVGNTSYFVSQTINGCESDKSVIVVQVNASAAFPVVANNSTYCVGSVAVPLTATGTNLKWYTSPNAGTANTIAPIPSTSLSGTVAYYVSQSIGSCESGRAAIFVQVNPKSTAPVVSSQLDYCVGATTSALAANGSDLKWYTTQTATTSSNVAPVPSTTAVGAKTYYVSQTASGCESDRSVITVNVHSSPDAPAVVTPVNYCQGSAVVPLAVIGSNVVWYKDGSALSVSPLPSTAIAGSVSYAVSQTVNGCESSKSMIVVQVNAAPIAPLVTNSVTYCVGVIASPLVASGANLKWYAQATGGAGDVAVPTPSTTVASVKEYFVSQTVNGCESDRSKIVVTITSAPAAPAAMSPVRYCVGLPASTLTATGSNLYWFLPVNGCSGSGAAPVPSTLVAGTVSYFVSQSTGGCESPKKEIVVIVTDRPQAPVVVSPLNLSTGAAASALTATGSNLKWYTTASGGPELASAPTPATNAVGNTDYYVSQTINGCESQRALIRVSVSGDISGPACFTLGGTASYQVSPSLTTNAVYYNWWVNGSAQIINTSGAQATVSVGQYYTTGEICVGINYNQAPWNKQVCRKIDLCSSSARLGNTEPEISVFRNPSTSAFTINASEDISNVTVYNTLGQKVSVVGTVLAGQDVAFGSELPAGMYVVQYQIQNLKYTKSIIKQ